jgi:rhodanese-related sulfurtransferase
MNTLQEWIFPSVKKIGFEDMKVAIKEKSMMINTMPSGEQSILIKGTIPYYEEEASINKILEQYEMKKKKIIVYGKHTLDESSERKAKQLIQLGFSHIFLYVGGLFEWLLLQDIYGKDEFPTTKVPRDLLEFRPLPTSFSDSHGFA